MQWKQVWDPVLRGGLVIIHKNTFQNFIKKIQK